MTHERGAVARPGSSEVGEVLLASRYRLGEPLGAGPTGHVYRAHDVLLDRTVAVKVLDGLVDRVATGRALRAARAAARAASPPLIEVLDVEHGRPAFVVLGLVQAEPLPQAAPGGLPLDRALTVADDVLVALAALHRAGAVHRDVRAEHVLLAEDGRAWLTSAGLAEAARDAGLGLRVAAENNRDGAVGSAPSPEQELGVAASARSDVAAAGALLTALLGGRAGPAVDRVLRRATLQDPEERHPDAGALHTALRAALPGTGAARGRGEGTAAGNGSTPAKEAGSRPTPRSTAGTGAGGGTGPAAGVAGAGPGRRVSRLAGRLALAAAGLVAAWLLIGVPITNLRAVPPPPEAAAPSTPGPSTGERAVLPSPRGLSPERLSAVLALGASSPGLAAETTDILERLQRLDRLRGAERDAEAAELYGWAAVAAGQDRAAAGAGPAGAPDDLPAAVADLLRDELTLAGLVALADRDPAAAGLPGGALPGRLAALAALEGEGLRAEALALRQLSEEGLADGSVPPPFAAAAQVVLEELAQPS